MCFDPVTMGIIGFAVTAAETISQYQAQKDNAQATRAAAVAAYENDQKQLSLRQIQEQDALSQKQQIEGLKAAKATSAVQLSAASAGVSGVSVDNLIADVQRQAGRNKETEFENTQAVVNQLQAQKEGSKAAAEGRINSAPAPSTLSLVAGLGGDALKGFETYDQTKSYST